MALLRPASVRAACVATLLALALGGPSIAKEPRAPASPEDIVAYHDSGEWKADTTAQVKKAKTYLGKWLRKHPKPRSRKPAIVLDIDDTSLSLYACAKAKDFESPQLCAVQTDLPAISQIRSLFRYAKQRHVAVFFITGRPEGLKTITVTALHNAGYKGKWKLYLRPSSDKHSSLVPYKSGARKKITRKGYRIIVNLGDQRSDLKGGYSLKAYKLPNPMYFTP